MAYDVDNKYCIDCQRDKDDCPDCFWEDEDEDTPSLYLSPDSYKEER